MTILYDHQIFEHQRIGGVSRYFSENIFHFRETVKTRISVLYSDNVYLKNFNLTSVKPIVDHRQKFIERIDFKGKGRIYDLLRSIFPSKYYDCNGRNRDYSIKLLKRQDFDVFHPTYYDDYFLEFIGNKPFVLTIHDMNYELFPEFFPVADQTVFKKKEIAQKAAHIIAVSENTKNDIINILGIPEKKISVIYHGVSNLTQDDLIPIELPERYLLFVGSRKGYKNFLLLIHAIADLLIKSDTHLICTGTPFCEEELRLFDYLKIRQRIRSYFVTESELNYLYKNALAFIFPSLYEGFGIPIIEAFANGCPVLLSDTSCFPEIAGDSALYFDPKSRDEISEQIQKVIYSDSLREEMKKKGKERAPLFTWQRSAKSTIEVYKKCASFL